MTIWVLGSGDFGGRAVKQLARRYDATDIVLVDPSQQALKAAYLPGINSVCEDGVAFLVRELTGRDSPDWIVPALPVHLVWEWAKRRVTGLERFALPDSLVASLPNVMVGASKDVYVSHADFICPPNCSEPDQICTRTGEARKEDMFAWLRKKGTDALPFFVVRSIQLGPGLGGYQPGVLFDLLETLKRRTGGPAP